MRRKPLRTISIGATIRHQRSNRNRELSWAYQGIEFPVMEKEQSRPVERGFNKRLPDILTSNVSILRSAT
jgi:hypothetical protein